MKLPYFTQCGVRCLLASGSNNDGYHLMHRTSISNDIRYCREELKSSKHKKTGTI